MYAAVAAKDSKGFAFVPKDTKTRNNRIKAVITANFTATETA
jgi:hypothetical protein